MSQFEIDDSDEALDSEPESAPTRRGRRRPPPSDINTFLDALNYAEPRPAPSARAGKGPYGTALSNAIAVLVANRLRPDFPGVLPNADGTGAESRARTGRGFKKLDVNYSTPELGLALGISIKTVNYRDPGTRRYTKNYSQRQRATRGGDRLPQAPTVLRPRRGPVPPGRRL